MASKLNGKLNDLFLSLLGGASDRYRLKLSKLDPTKLEQDPKLLSNFDTRMAMGVNIRSGESKEQSGNIVGPIFGSIPLNISLLEYPQKRFDLVRKNMNFWPNSFHNHTLTDIYSYWGPCCFQIKLQWI